MLIEQLSTGSSAALESTSVWFLLSNILPEYYRLIADHTPQIGISGTPRDGVLAPNTSQSLSAPFLPTTDQSRDQI